MGNLAPTLGLDHPVVAAERSLDIDYNEAAKKIVASVLGKVPYVGFALGGLVTLLWPSNEKDIWAAIKDKVEALINQKISQEVWRQTEDALAGLRNVLDDYLYAARNFPDDPKVVSEKWNIAQGHFLHDLPAFQSRDYQLLLLPLFAQFGNLHLFLLRDGALFGAKWGWSSAVVDRVRAQLTDGIAKYGTYTADTYTAGLNSTRAKAPSNKQKTEPFNTVNRFQREMTLTVSDFALTWPYFDVVKYPNPVTDIPVTREIYSNVVGTADDTGVSLPAAPPTKPIQRITAWGWDRIDAIQVDYPDGGGPDRRSSTGRMGNANGGSNQPPWGGVFDLAQRGAVARVKARTGDIVNAMWLIFENGQSSNQLGGKYPGGGDSEWHYDGEILSSIKIMGVSRFYGSANAAVFGFKYKNERFPPPSADVLRALFIGDPAAPSPKVLAAKLDLTPQDAGELEAWARTYEWESLRHHAATAQHHRLEAAKR